MSYRKGKRLTLNDLRKMDEQIVVGIHDNKENIYKVELNYNLHDDVKGTLLDINHRFLWTLDSSQSILQVFEYIEDKVEKIEIQSNDNSNKLNECILNIEKYCENTYKEYQASLNKSKIQYKGWEILKMIDKGELKDDDIVTIEYGKVITISKLKEAMGTMEFLMKTMFTIKEKEYVTFDEARKFGTPRHKDFGYYLPEKFKKIESLIEEMNEKVWEIKN